MWCLMLGLGLKLKIYDINQQVYDASSASAFTHSNMPTNKTITVNKQTTKAENSLPAINKNWKL